MATGKNRRPPPVPLRETTDRVILDPAPRTSATGGPSPKKYKKFVSRADSIIRVWVDPITKVEYPSRSLMEDAVRRRRARVLRDFAEMLETDTLGQLPWEQLPGETPLQYERFRTYLFIQPKEVIIDRRTGKPIGAIGNRSIRRAECKMGLKEGACHKVATSRHWTLRAQAWDREMERVQDEEFREAKRSAARRQAKLGQTLQGLASAGAVQLERNIRLGVAEMDGNTIARLADIGVKTERLAHGDSTTNDDRNSQTILVWQGAKPKWADSAELVVEQEQVVAGPLEQRLIDAGNGEADPGRPEILPPDHPARRGVRELTDPSAPVIIRQRRGTD